MAVRSHLWAELFKQEAYAILSDWTVEIYTRSVGKPSNFHPFFRCVDKLSSLTLQMEYGPKPMFVCGVDYFAPTLI